MDDIGMERHPNTTQFFRVESGRGIAIIGGNTYKLKDGVVVIVPPGKKHNIINTSKTSSLLLYTIYSPPMHPPHTKILHKPESE